MGLAPAPRARLVARARPTSPTLAPALTPPAAIHPHHPPPRRSAYLADAFQGHLQRNELLHEVFRFSPAEEPEERLTPLEKRLFRSKSSTDVRDRTEQRRRARAQTASYKGASLADFA